MAENYIKYMNLNKSKLATLLDQARGSRTMKKFAEDCGVNPSTFSRILNQTNKGSSSEDLIRVIAEQADPESGVTLDMLMEANGYLPENDRTAFRELQMKFESEAEEIIFYQLKSLLDNNVVMEPQRFRISKSMSIAPDILVENVCLDGKEGAWLIDVMPSMHSFSYMTGRTSDARREEFMIARRLQERLGRYFSAYCMMDEYRKISRISLAVFDEMLFEQIIELYGNYKTDDSISFILVDLEQRRIEEEYVLRNRAGAPGESLINSLRKNSDMFDDDFDDIYWDDSEE